MARKFAALLAGVSLFALPAEAQNYPAPSRPLVGGETIPCLQSGTYRACTPLDLASVPGAVVSAAAQPGGDMGAQINAALALLPSTGGVVDARGLTGAQTLTTPITIGQHQIVELGSAQITLSGIVTIGAGGALIGIPAGPGTGGSVSATTITEAGGANLAEMVLIAGVSATIQNLTLDGNKGGQTSAGPNLVVSGQWAFIKGVTFQNSFSHNFAFVSTGTTDQACCGVVHDVIAINGTGDGLYCIGTTDIMISESSFENNAGSAGIELYDCPAIRLDNYDIGGNKKGYWVHGHDYSPGNYNGSNAEIIGIGQFGNNSQQDILIDGSGSTNQASFGNVIAGALLIGSSFRTPNTYPAIELVNMAKGGNVISGVQINAHQSQEFTDAVYVHGVEGADTINARATGTFGAATFNVLANTALNYACDTNAATCQSTNGIHLKPVFQGNATGNAATAQTAGASAADQYALNLSNPSTASFATVTQTFSDGTGALAQIFGQRNGTGSGTWLLMQTEKAGVMTPAIKIDDQQNVSVLNGAFGIPLVTWADNKTCTVGQISVDASYVYVCTASNTVKRVALTAF